MALFEHFPYTNFHQMNLDWLLNRVKNIETEVEYVAKNTGADTFIVNIYYDADSGTWKCDTDYRKIIDAYIAGQKLAAVVNGVTYPGTLTYIGDIPSAAVFRGMEVTDVTNSSADLTFREFNVSATTTAVEYTVTV